MLVVVFFSLIARGYNDLIHTYPLEFLKTFSWLDPVSRFNASIKFELIIGISVVNVGFSRDSFKQLPRVGGTKIIY